MLREEGIRTVFGDALHDGRLSGQEAVPGGWRSVEDAPVLGLHDRFPSTSETERWRVLLAEAGALPVVNSPRFSEMCRDKVATQRFLEGSGLPVPPVETDPERFAERLDAWGAAFLKPRYGALGRGVRRVRPGDPLPAWGVGLVSDRPEPLLLQRAVPPPSGEIGLCARLLLQRDAEGAWRMPALVLRRGKEDPVVNAARGAEILPAEALLAAETLAAMRDLGQAMGLALDRRPDAALLVETGVDLVLDEDWRPWVLEMNHKPLGRLEGAAHLDPARFHAEHVEACARPLRRLAALLRREDLAHA
jgi:glutathione synthase/RimK-type ligase-like ATP-grasp enzyme